jgi:hypothetical protein
MSIQQMVLVFSHSRAENTDRLVLLALANHAGGDGCDAYPSIGTIAREARCGESTVRAAIERLKALGELTETGVSPLATRSFRLTLPDSPAPPREAAKRAWQRDTPADPAPPQDLHPRRICTPPQDLAAPPQDLRPGGAGSAPEPSITVLEPSTARERAETVKHNGRRVPAERLALAERILADFNGQAGTGYGARKASGAPSENLRRVLTALGDHADITADVAHRMIAQQLARPYWQGRPDLGNVFGPRVVERNLEDARNPVALKSVSGGGGIDRSQYDRRMIGGRAGA